MIDHRNGTTAPRLTACRRYLAHQSVNRASTSKGFVGWCDAVPAIDTPQETADVDADPVDDPSPWTHLSLHPTPRQRCQALPGGATAHRVPPRSGPESARARRPVEGAEHDHPDPLQHSRRDSIVSVTFRWRSARREWSRMSRTTLGSSTVRCSQPSIRSRHPPPPGGGRGRDNAESLPAWILAVAASSRGWALRSCR